ncbi:MAG: cytochrome P450, partial [Bacteroidia bacterium]|nr:cytochrome P450 [Bacteroidia bacterium]
MGRLPGIQEVGAREAWRILWRLRKGSRGLAGALEQLRMRLGDIFSVKIGKFELVVVAHPQGLREALVEKREAFAWRVEGEPIVKLLRRGVLVQDGEAHRFTRGVMELSNRRAHLFPRLESLYAEVDRVTALWREEAVYDMRVEMRKVALFAFERVYFSHDIAPELPGLWEPILSLIRYIGPGIWLFWGAVSPPRSLSRVDAHLFQLIHKRKRDKNPPDDMLTHLLQAFPEDEERIRDQMLTMLIAGHDTSTAALAWSLYILGREPRWQERLREEIRDHLGGRPPLPSDVADLIHMDAFVKEVLRLYPPIHAGNRRVRHAVELMGFPLFEGQRVLLSYYLVHRHPRYWEGPSSFMPERWLRGEKRDSFAYLPFGGGPRMCIGAPFAQLELRLILVRLLQTFRFSLVKSGVTPDMGATLEPYPGAVS